jgi:hypothetical protein
MTTACKTGEATDGLIDHSQFYALHLLCGIAAVLIMLLHPTA